jgi:hypothetical protein
MRSHILETRNTSLIVDGSHNPVQGLNPRNNQRNAKYISHVGWKSVTIQRSNTGNKPRNTNYISRVAYESYADSKVECIHKSKMCSIHLSLWMKSYVRCKKSNAFRNQRNTKYFSHFRWKSYQGYVGYQSQCQGLLLHAHSIRTKELMRTFVETDAITKLNVELTRYAQISAVPAW